MRNHGLFLEVHDEMRQFIVATVDPEGVAKLLPPGHDGPDHADPENRGVASGPVPRREPAFVIVSGDYGPFRAGGFFPCSLSPWGRGWRPRRRRGALRARFGWLPATLRASPTHRSSKGREVPVR